MREIWTNTLKQALACICLVCPASIALAESTPIEVDMQLVLAVDISFSISRDEQDIQRRGYVAAFQNPEVIAAITSGYRGRIAVTYMEWAGEDIQFQVVPWTLIYDPQSAVSFSQKLSRMQVNRRGRTSISKALETSIKLLRQSPFQANRHVVDISSDGFNNNGPRVDRIRDKLVYNGVTINGLPLMAGNGAGSKASLALYFQDCVIGGFGAFMEPMLNWDEFGPTLNRKLVLEISGHEQAPVHLAASLPNLRPKMDCLLGEKEELKQYINQLNEAVGKDRAPRWLPRKQDWPMPD